LVEHWRHVLTTDYGLRTTDFQIGIVWQGNPHHRLDRYRSIPLQEFAPLARVPGVQLISLQRGAGTEQLKEVGEVGRPAPNSGLSCARVSRPRTFPIMELPGELDKT